jgi:hypothetical protein
MHLINKDHITVIKKVILRVMEAFIVSATSRTANTVFTVITWSNWQSSFCLSFLKYVSFVTEKSRKRRIFLDSLCFSVNKASVSHERWHKFEYKFNWQLAPELHSECSTWRWAGLYRFAVRRYPPLNIMCSTNDLNFYWPSLNEALEIYS